MRSIYTLDIEQFEDDTRFNPSGIGFIVTIFDHGENIGDGVADNQSDAIREALREAGLDNA